MAEKTALEKSHSKSSNAKLTLICFLAIIAFAAFWIGLALIFMEDYKMFGYIMAPAGGVVAILAFLLIGKFNRG